MAAGNATLTTLSNVLKTRFEKKLQIMSYEDDHFLTNVAKATDFGGKDYRQSLRYGSPQGGSSVLATAIANKTSSEDVGFLVTRVRDYHVCSIDAEAMFAGQGDENTVIDAMDGEMEGGLRMIGRSLQIGVWGDGSGRRGAIDATVTGTTLTLSDPNEIVNFEVDMKIQFVHPATLTNRAGGPLTITSVDRDNGSMVVSANLNTITSLTAGDYIVRDGDTGVMMKGLAAWLPLVKPTGGDNFFGVNRSVDSTRLAGVIFDGAEAQKSETLIKAVVRLSREGGTHAKRVGYLHLDDLADIAIGLGAKAEYMPAKDSEGVIGFASLMIHTPRGPLKLYSSLNCKKGEFFILQMDTWKLKTLKKAPHIVDDDGQTVVRGATTDDVTWRLRYWGNLVCNAPGWNCHGTF